MNGPARPVTLLIAAMGGEGGGVLMEWVVQAATRSGVAVQSTAIPGVAQRTGATTYYVELLAPAAGPAGRPVFSLYPSPGEVDVMLASELLEAGRALQNGYVSPDRTTLIASSHRVYAIAERTAMADGRFDAARVERAAAELARDLVLFDMDAAAREAGSVINAVMLGALAGTGRLPLPADALEAAVRAEGKAVEANLRGFRLGRERAGGGAAAVAAPAAAPPPGLPDDLARRLDAEFPEPARALLRHGAARLVDWEGPAYAGRYLDRLAPLAAADPDGTLVAEAGRWLARWMAYEDVVQVARAKTRPERFAAVRREVGAAPDQPVRIVEFLKPGIDEAASLLPPALARPLLAWAGRGDRRRRLHLGLAIPSSSLWGWALLRGTAGLRGVRRHGWRYRVEQQAIVDWLALVREAARLDAALGHEVAACARLVKGYSDTRDRGRQRFDGIMASLVRPTLAGEMDAGAAAAAIRRARTAATGDPEGKALAAELGRPAA